LDEDSGFSGVNGSEVCVFDAVQNGPICFEILQYFM